jgi:hypothetical protein
MSLSTTDFCKKYAELKILAMTYLKELLTAQEKAPNNFRNNVVDWCNGITVENIEVEGDRILANYRVDQWDCSGAWHLDITDRDGIDEKLNELGQRVDTFHANVKKARAENEKKEKAEFVRLSKIFPKTSD